MNSVADTLYEFGGFRLDPVRRLLTREGTVVPLTPKVFDTLLALVSRSGQIVEKEDLLKEVWRGVAVEEIGLTKNISTLRKALGESRDEHRYIVTLPGRGYSFVAPVTSVLAAVAGMIPPAGKETEAGEIVETHAVVRLISQEKVIQAKEPPILSEPPRKHRFWRVTSIVASVLMLAGVALLLYFRNGPPLTDKESILLADFVNRTGDPVFDQTLKQGLAVQLEQSPLLDIFPEERARRTLRFMGRSPDERVTPTIAREICQRQGLKAFITGSIAALGTHYAITLEGIEGQTGATLARVQAEAENKEQVLRTLSDLASHLRQRLGESLGSIQKYDALLERTTSSLEALQALSLGGQEGRRGRAQAMAFYRRALELDPNFAFAYSRMAVAYRNDRQRALAAEYTAKAYALRDRLSERERLYITSLYHELVTGDIGKNIEALQVFQQIYPNEAMPHNNLAVAYVTLGQFEQAVQEARIAMRIEGNLAVRYAVLGNSLIRLNRFEEAADLYRRALEQKLEDFSIHRGLFRIAFVNGDTTAMERELNWASRNSHEGAALEWQARSAAFAGQWRRSEVYAARAIESANRNHEPEVGAVYTAESALRGAALGQCAGVRTESSQTSSAGTRASAEDEVSLSRLGLALALCGESAAAQSKLAELEKRYPQSTLMNGIWLPTIQSAIELRSGNAVRAIDLLEPARRYEAAAEFWPQYLRAQAYLRQGKGAEAAAEFSKILDHSGQDVASPLSPLANLGLAKSMHLQHEIAKARKSAEAFLLEWKEADSHLPFLKEARAEFNDSK